MIKIKKGLDLPISGSPSLNIGEGHPITEVAILGEDYNGMKPTMLVKENDSVRLGQPLFSDKKNPGVLFTAPASGTVKAINRGAKRKLISVVIEKQGNEQVSFACYPSEQLDSLDRNLIVDNLVQSGLWTSFKTRPFSKIPKIDAEPKALFVTAIDTHPLSADPNMVITQEEKAFNQGLQVIKHLTSGALHVCTNHEAKFNISTGKHSVFNGPHPAGLTGTHIHFLEGSSMQHSVWSIGYQDVIAIGKLFTTGQLHLERIVALGGPSAKNPRLVKTWMGANIDELLTNEVEHGDIRVISGSIFGGFTATKNRAYLGRYHHQVSMLPEGREKEFFGWISPGRYKFSMTRTFISHFFSKRRFDLTTSTGGSERALMPIGSYEQIMPLDILATQLLRALLSNDIEMAQALGCLELDEEDLSLCTFVCPGKHEFGPILRQMLNTIEKEG